MSEPLLTLLFLTLTTPAQASPPALAAGAASRSAPALKTEDVTARFREELAVAQDPLLRGLSSTRTLTFTRPSWWNLVGTPELHLRLSHSDALVPDRSSLTVTVNDHPVGTVRLTPDNAADTEVVLPLPPELLTDVNALGLVADQHASATCENPFDPALWTRIGGASFLSFRRAVTPVEAQLPDFPYPLFDGLGYGPVRLTLVAPGPLTPGSLDALGGLAFTLGRFAGARRLEMEAPVARLRDATTAAVLLGTPEENPGIAELVDLAGVTGNQGLVAVLPNPANPALPVLVVTGRTSDGVAHALEALVRPDRASFLSGTRSVVDATPLGPAPASTAHPHGDVVTLRELGAGDHTAWGFYATPVTVRLPVEGDGHVSPGGGRLNLHYAYGPGLDPRLSTLEVRVGDAGVASVPLWQREGDSKAELVVDLPERLVTPGADLEVVANLFPDGFTTCDGVASGRQLWTTIFADSRVTLPREHYADLPDLALLRHGGWPFSAEADGERVFIVIGDAASGEEAAAGMQVAADLAGRSDADRSDVHLTTSATSAAESGYQIVLTTWKSPHALYHTLETGGALLTAGTQLRTMRDATGETLTAHIGADYATIEEVQPSDRPGETILVLRAADAPALRGLARLVGTDARLAELSGAVAVVTPDEHFRTVDPLETHRVSRMSRMGAVRLGVEENSALFTLLTLPGVLVAASWLSRWARRNGGTT